VYEKNYWAPQNNNYISNNIESSSQHKTTHTCMKNKLCKVMRMMDKCTKYHYKTVYCMRDTVPTMYNHKAQSFNNWQKNSSLFPCLQIMLSSDNRKTHQPFFFSFRNLPTTIFQAFDIWSMDKFTATNNVAFYIKATLIVSAIQCLEG